MQNVIIGIVGAVVLWLLRKPILKFGKDVVTNTYGRVVGFFGKLLFVVAIAILISLAAAGIPR
jgi:hypothetical protein